VAENQRSPYWPWVPEWLIGDIWHHPYAYKTFSKYIPYGSRVLEIGFGSGRILTRIAKELNCQCVGVDIDEGAFKALSFFSAYHGVEIAAVKGSGFLLPFRDNTFDVVYSEGVIEHFSSEESEQMLKEHVRVCREGGLVIVSVPNKLAVFHSLTKVLLGERFLFYPERSLSRFELSDLLSHSGLTALKWDGFAFGCQFWSFKAFVLDPLLPPSFREIGARLLAQLTKTKVYHFENSWLNSLFGFQTLVAGRKNRV